MDLELLKNVSDMGTTGILVVILVLVLTKGWTFFDKLLNNHMKHIQEATMKTQEGIEVIKDEHGKKLDRIANTLENMLVFFKK